MARFDKTPLQLAISDLSHDGRGVARTDEGKTVFVQGALPGERVIAVRTARSRRYDEARTLEVLSPSADRVAPRCPHFGICSGCVLQHLAGDRQILAKQRILLENLERLGQVKTETLLPPLTAGEWDYRRKGRFSVRHVEKKGKTLVGFRECDPRFVADLSVCHTVVPEVGEKISVIAALVNRLASRRSIPQIEFIHGDAVTALTFRHLTPLEEGDRAALMEFNQDHGFAVYLQPKGVDSIHALMQTPSRLTFALSDWDVEFEFEPLDFIQVNARLNEKMITQALRLLDLTPGQRVLDLFCGLGNFTLPLARSGVQVTGVEGDAGLVARARANAARNDLDNARFYAADLTQDQRGTEWMRQTFDALLLDPPRSGADAVLRQLPLNEVDRIVYVSCHPGSLARDAGFLVKERGYTLVAAGVMDMFPQTAHVESIALFQR